MPGAADPRPSGPHAEGRGYQGAEGRARRISAPPGGTAVEVPPGRGRWLALGLLLAVACGAGAAVALTRGPQSSAPPAPASEGVDERAAEAAEPVGRPAGARRGSAPASAPAQRPNPADAIGTLRRALSKARLFAQLAPDGEHLELRSASCDDSRLGALLDEAKEALVESGFRRVRCLQPHGQVVFERDL